MVYLRFVIIELRLLSFFKETEAESNHKKHKYIFLRYKIIHTNEILVHKETKTQ